MAFPIPPCWRQVVRPAFVNVGYDKRSSAIALRLILLFTDSDS